MPVQCWVHWQLFGISSTSSFKTLHPSGSLASASPESSGSSTSIVCLTSQPISGVQVWQVVPPHPRLHLHACSSSAVSTQIPLLLQSGNEFGSESSARHLGTSQRAPCQLSWQWQVNGSPISTPSTVLMQPPLTQPGMSMQVPQSNPSHPISQTQMLGNLHS